jgi:cupin 2 domain-containing protein
MASAPPRENVSRCRRDRFPHPPSPPKGEGIWTAVRATLTVSSGPVGDVETEKRNLFSNLPSPETGEDFLELLHCRNVVIERIVSSDRPDPRTYDQAQDEWVLLLQGEASLEISDRDVTLHAGDHIFIPARTPHRVLATSGEPPCVWLAVHIHPCALTR